MDEMTSAAPEAATTTTETAAPSAAESTVSAGVSAADVSSSAGSAQPDWKSQYEALHSNYSSLQGQLSEYQQAQQQYQQQMQQFMLKTFAPEQYQRMQQPTYVTADMMQRQIAQMQNDFKVQQLANQFSGELASAKEKFSEVFDQFPGAEQYIASQWERSNKSVAQIAKELNDQLAKVYEKRQAAVLQQKQTVAQKTSGSPRASGTPSNAGPKGGGFRGMLGRLRNGAGE